jgi:hypothetical protein
MTKQPEASGDAAFLKRVKLATTPAEILQIIVSNSSLFGHDPYYADLAAAMLEQAEKVLKEPR